MCLPDSFDLNPMHYKLCLAMQECVCQKPVHVIDELKQRLIDLPWIQQMKSLISGEIVLIRVSEPKANTLNICCDVLLRKCKLGVNISFPN